MSQKQKSEAMENFSFFLSTMFTNYPAAYPALADGMGQSKTPGV